MQIHINAHRDKRLKTAYILWLRVGNLFGVLLINCSVMVIMYGISLVGASPKC